MSRAPALLLVVLASLFSAASAQANSTVADTGGGEFTLTDDTGNSNFYVLNNSKASGRWVIYDKTGGKVRIKGASNPCQDTSFIVKSDTHPGDDTFLGVSCPPRTTLKASMGANSPGDDTYDQINPSVAAGDFSNPFSGRLDVDGGTGVNVIRGTNQSDHLQGGPDGDFLLGRDGDDTLLGGNGNDNLDGGPGADDMAGQDGSDDKCCYWDRGEDVKLSTDGAANDGSAQDRNADDIDESNEILAAGAGADTIDTRLAAVPAGSSCDRLDHFRLEGGDANDKLWGNTCYGDDFDGQGGYDTADFKDRSDDLFIGQDNQANDGAFGRAEHDNVRDSVEAVVSGGGDDVIVGADDGSGVPTGTRGLLIAWAGNDVVVPGLRAEDLYADGTTGSPGDKDFVSYASRPDAIQLSLNGGADDGTVNADQTTREHDNVANGFEQVLLGKGDDNYYGPHAYDIPQSQLPAYETTAQRIRVSGGEGSDKLYPGSTAEDLQGDGGIDRASYILREPGPGRLTQVSLTQDGVANDGQTINTPSPSKIVTAIALAAVAYKFKLAKPATIEELGTVNIVKVDTDKLIVAFRTTEHGWITKIADEALALFRKVPERLVYPATNLKTYMRSLVVKFEETLVKSRNKLGVLFGAPAAFGSSGDEQDNIFDDIEQLQGSTNTSDGGLIPGLISKPQDFIQGNGNDNVVLGSPGPDHVEGLGGNDTIYGDIAGNPADDQLLGGPGYDYIEGGGGADYIFGGLQPDTIYTNTYDFRDDAAQDQIFCGDEDLQPLFPWLDNPLDPSDGDTLVTSSADGDWVPLRCSLNGNPQSDKTTATATATSSQVTLTGKPGLKNIVKVTKVGTNYEIADTKGKVETGAGCSAKIGKPAVAVCPARSNFKANLGDLKDTFKAKLDSTVTTTIDGGPDKDTIVMGASKDTLIGAEGNDKLKAGDGDDTLQGGPGADNMNGGAGQDTISYAEKAAPVDVYLAQPSTSHNGETSFTLNTFTTHGAADLEGDVISWAESAIGGYGADILQGNQLDNTLEGGAGADAFSGGPGSDTIKAKDGTKDPSILCGDGFDHYQVDAVDSITANSSCEALL